MADDLDLHVYLNIEMTIVLLQWISFSAMPSGTSNPLSVVTVYLSTFWCFVLFCSDLKVFFKRLIYPVLSWCQSNLGTVGFFLVMLLGCGLWYLVSLCWLVSIII